MAEIVSRLAWRPRIKSWTDGTTWTNWSKHEAYLHGMGTWKPQQVDSVGDESLRIISKTMSLTRTEFQCRGLVVGYVQSGKTANFTAVAARAADVGYRLIIVLSGIHDALRNQTQARMRKELIDVGVNWTSLTDGDSDFITPLHPDGFGSTGTVLVVAKKLPPILQRIDAWIEQLGARMADLPTLIIDDEADQASINTRGNRRDPSVDADDEANPNEAPTRTNLLIRTILQRIPKATYIAYTATPFANLFINPMAYDEEAGSDLFPRDFVVQLPRPEGYTGTEELFGPSAQGRDVMRLVDGEDVRVFKSKSAKKGDALLVASDERGIPQSLCDAILAFCVVGAVREARGLNAKPHTMLMHVSHQKKDQIRIGGSVEKQIAAWRNSELVTPGYMHNPMRSALAGLGTIILPEGITQDAIVLGAIKVLNLLDVTVLNSDTKEDLGYDGRPDRHIVAIGGNKLSRGLTLEGLTIAYFLRTTTMADSLLQMCRWYGFRLGYGDLIRIWTTQVIADWFVELSLVEQSLRDGIVRLDRAGKRPDEMAVAIRGHADLMLTSKAKSRMQEETSRSWSLQNPQTIMLPIQELTALRENLRATIDLLLSHPPTRDQYGGAIAYDVPASAIIGYLRRYVTHVGAIAFRSADLADWIIARNERGELTRWTIFVASPQRDRQVMIGSRSYGLVTRTPTGVEGIGILTEPRHEGVDLPGGPDPFKGASSFNVQAMRSNRSSTNGLLLIYPLDASPFQVDVATVIALGMSLPRTSDEGETLFANKGIGDG